MTIAKNTNRAKATIQNARDIRCFSLGNNFSGQLIASDFNASNFLAGQLNSLHSKLTGKDGYYVLHVDSNLWYEFKA